jgi:hypothetical protein
MREFSVDITAGDFAFAAGGRRSMVGLGGGSGFLVMPRSIGRALCMFNPTDEALRQAG